MDNAVRLFLLASNLGSRTITSWCAEFLRPRVSRENVEQIWSVANATKNTRMIDLCVPFIAAHFDAITTGVKFQSTTEPDSLSTLLSDDRLVGVAEAAKLRAVAMWFEANRTANTEDLTEFVGGLDNSLGAIDLGKITSDDFVEFCMSDCWINLRREFRDLISNAWKEVRMRGPTHDYLIAYTDPSNEVTFATSEWEEFEKKILGRSSGAQLPTVDVNFRLTMPSRSECAVVMLSESMYMIGGRDEKGEVSRLVDRVDPFDGRVLGAAPMEHERCSFSAAADFSGQQLLVFGGENGTTEMSSCEKFDSATNRWTPLPDMPTERSCCGTAIVPGVGVVVVGGYTFTRGALCTAELLSCSTEDNGVENWSWRQLAPMRKPRSHPGVAYFRGRVVVVGDGWNVNNGVECLRLPADDNDPGQWTRLQTLEKATPQTNSLVVLKHRLLLAGVTWSLQPCRSTVRSRTVTWNAHPLPDCRDLASSQM
uniref:BACK domain-containing protein n=1 Tax=Mesocestoides corti TaxID=53468 RepID=A0A5K3FWA8_MESCO